MSSACREKQVQVMCQVRIMVRCAIQLAAHTRLAFALPQCVDSLDIS
jgi:hypothetical protein